jgi:hypothetical protein
MRVLRKWIGFVVILALVITTTPFPCRAATVSNFCGVKITEAEQGQAAVNFLQGVKKLAADVSIVKPYQANQSFCDNNCYCLGNSCGGAIGILVNNSAGTFLSKFERSHFRCAGESPPSGLQNRIKRPPRA